MKSGMEVVVVDEYKIGERSGTLIKFRFKGEMEEFWASMQAFQL